MVGMLMMVLVELAVLGGGLCAMCGYLVIAFHGFWICG